LALVVIACDAGQSLVQGGAAGKWWPTEKLSAAEVTRLLALTQLLWAESERGMVESVRTSA